MLPTCACCLSLCAAKIPLTPPPKMITSILERQSSVLLCMLSTLRWQSGRSSCEALDNPAQVLVVRQVDGVQESAIAGVRHTFFCTRAANLTPTQQPFWNGQSFWRLCDEAAVISDIAPHVFKIVWVLGLICAQCTLAHISIQMLPHSA